MLLKMMLLLALVVNIMVVPLVLAHIVPFFFPVVLSCLTFLVLLSAKVNGLRVLPARQVYRVAGGTTLPQVHPLTCSCVQCERARNAPTELIETLQERNQKRGL